MDIIKYLPLELKYEILDYVEFNEIKYIKMPKIMDELICKTKNIKIILDNIHNLILPNPPELCHYSIIDKILGNKYYDYYWSNKKIRRYNRSKSWSIY